MTRAATRKNQAKEWLWAVPLLLLGSWIAPFIDRLIVAVLSAVLVTLCLFAMPTWCCAPTQAGKPCLINTRGVFAACHIHAHQQAKLRMRFTRRYWRGLARGEYSGLRGALAVYLSAAGLISGLAALIVRLTQ